MEIYVTIEDIKKHLNVDYEGEDTYLSDLIETAQTSVETYICQPLETFVKDGRLNPMLKHAIRVIAANFYANRESVAFAQARPVPYTLDYLLRPFILYR